MTPALQARLEQARNEMRSGQTDKARATLQRAMSQHPASPEPVMGLAVLFVNTGQNDQAAFFAQRAADLAPADPRAQFEAANILILARKLDAAGELYRRALALGAEAEGEHGLANTLLEVERFAEALPHARRAQHLRPGESPTVSVLATILTVHGRADEAASLLASVPPDDSLAPLTAFTMNYVPGATPAEIFAAHLRSGELLERVHPRSTEAFTNTPDPDRPIRVGLLSHELRRHPVAIFLEPWLARHDRARIELHLYNTSPVRDAATERLKSYGHRWRDLSGSSDADAERQIRADRIDILLESSGITTGNRAELLARKPAPVQAMYLGYPGTTGMRAIDFRIVDPRTEPPGAEQFSTERLIRLDPTFHCFRADPDSPELTPPPSLAAGHVTFGSFNSTQKINPIVIDTWCRVLAAVPGSRLLLKTVHLADAELRRSFESEFARRAVAPGRVEVLPPTRPYTDHLAHYARVDVALDTFPYNGTTTTCEALWMGVPVVAIAGRTHPGRVGEALLHALGRPEWLTPDVESYTRLAADLAQGTAQRTMLRSSGPAGLRAALRSSPLMDEPGHARRMDAALRLMWHDWCHRRSSDP